jgi:hypothetical protein
MQGEKYNEFRVVCGTQNSVRILGELLTYSENMRKVFEHTQRIEYAKNLAVFSLFAKRHTVISVLSQFLLGIF